jgi:prepilin-type processing-associated H-X9-DG protein
MRPLTIQKLMLGIAAVAVILGALMGLVRVASQPSVASARTRCQSNLHNIAIALMGYHEYFGAFPSGTLPNPNLPPEKRLSWYVPIHSYLDYQLWDSIHENQSWDHGSHDRIATLRLGVLVCSDVSAPGGGHVPTQYIGIAGVGTDAPFLPKGHPRAGVFGYERCTALSDITDGAGYTIIVAESGRVRASWLAGGPATVRGLDTSELPYMGTGRQFGGIHPNGMNAAFADGSVRFIHDRVNPQALEALSTVAGGETLPPSAFD